MTLLFNPFTVGNYRWSEMLFWITSIFILAFGVLLFVDYLNNRNKSHLLWSVAFTSIFAVIYNVLTYAHTTPGATRTDPTVFDFTGDYAQLLWPNMQAINYVIINTLMWMTPALIAAGLLYATFDNKKFGDMFLIFMGIMLPIIIILMVDTTNETNPDIPGLAVLAVMILHVPSYLAIILLPILRNKDEKEGYLISVAGLILAVCSILFVVITLGTDISQLEGEFIDIVFMIYPFLIMAAVIFLAFGVLIPKKWSFSIPGVEFEERQAPA